MKKKIILSFALMLILLINILGVFAVTPTSEWRDFYGKVTGGKVGDLIFAKDPSGIVCGEFTIKDTGYYGFLHCYADDKLTSADEGANAGDEISFYFGNNIIGKGIFDSGKEIINLDLVLKECKESWKCTSFSRCINWTKTRTCFDRNDCGSELKKPIEEKECKCKERWRCSKWSACSEGLKTRTCIDTNECGGELKKPAEEKKCSRFFRWW